MGKFEVTQGQWQAVMGRNPSSFSSCGMNCPVENVSWHDAQEFVRRLNQRTGQTYRLPSEAEWEYAARAGSTTAYPWGERASRDHANYGADTCCSGLAEGRDRWEQTAPVGQFLANAFGLHDMHGNVCEWVQDVWHDTYAGAPSDGSAWMSGGDPLRRVLRDGSWYDAPQGLRSANRIWITPAIRFDFTGFRIARTF
jgi:formylglycine-generating enzyme required for sulfatase activity